MITVSQSQDNFKRGTAEMLILYLLRDEDLYGYQLTQLFAAKSLGTYTMLEGTLYSILSAWSQQAISASMRCL